MQSQCNTAPATLAREVFDSLGDLYKLIRHHRATDRGLEAAGTLDELHERYERAIASTTALAALAVKNGAPQAEVIPEGAPGAGALARAGDPSGRLEAVGLLQPIDDGRTAPAEQLDHAVKPIAQLERGRAVLVADLGQKLLDLRGADAGRVGRSAHVAASSSAGDVAGGVAESEGFEPPNAFASPDFESGAHDHDPTSCADACCNSPIDVEAAPRAPHRLELEAALREAAHELLSAALVMYDDELRDPLPYFEPPRQIPRTWSSKAAAAFAAFEVLGVDPVRADPATRELLPWTAAPAEIERRPIAAAP